MLDSDRENVQYFLPLPAVDRFYCSCIYFRMCPVKTWMRVFTSDFRIVSNVLVRFRLWLGHVSLEISQLGAFFHLSSACSYGHSNRVLWISMVLLFQTNSSAMQLSFMS